MIQTLEALLLLAVEVLHLGAGDAAVAVEVHEAEEPGQFLLDGGWGGGQERVKGVRVNFLLPIVWQFLVKCCSFSAVSAPNFASISPFSRLDE